MNIVCDKMVYTVVPNQSYRNWEIGNENYKLPTSSIKDFNSLDEALEYSAAFILEHTTNISSIQVIGAAHYTITDNGEDTYTQVDGNANTTEGENSSES